MRNLTPAVAWSCWAALIFVLAACGEDNSPNPAPPVDNPGVENPDDREMTPPDDREMTPPDDREMTPPDEPHISDPEMNRFAEDCVNAGGDVMSAPPPIACNVRGDVYGPGDELPDPEEVDEFEMLSNYLERSWCITQVDGDLSCERPTWNEEWQTFGPFPGSLVDIVYEGFKSRNDSNCWHQDDVIAMKWICIPNFPEENSEIGYRIYYSSADELPSVEEMASVFSRSHD
ncbi:hypothetical protein H6758_03875 [Candidatus Nomurabacteria bacterium]|nr:hypothetical protein [Candidatus Nomurabacteria bacterium]